MLLRVFTAAVLAVGFASCGSVQAGFFSSLLVDGQVNMLEDFDREIYLGPTLAPEDTINVGGFLIGAWQIENTESLPGTVTNELPLGGQTLTIVFATEVLTKVDTGVVGSNNRFQYTLGAAPQSVWNSLGLNRNNDGTLLALYEDSNGGFTNFAADGTITPISQSLDTAQDGNLVFEFGFTGVDGAAAGNEFWNAQSRTDSSLDAGGLETPVGYSAGLNVTFDNDPTVILNNHNFLGASSGETQVQLFGGVENPATLVNSLPVNTDTDVYINPSIVPEPTSFAIFGVMGLAGLGIRRRRA